MWCVLPGRGRDTPKARRGRTATETFQLAAEEVVEVIEGRVVGGVVRRPLELQAAVRVGKRTVGRPVPHSASLQGVNV